jgi:hypothetical protein
MKPENLEALLLDRALGQLSPEVEDLLAAHVAREPAAARRAELLAGTVALARRVATAQVPPQSRASRGDEAQWRRVQRALRWRAAGRDALKIAAGLMLGLGLVWLARVPPVAPLAAPVAVVAVPAGPVAHAAPAFWSKARVVAESQRASAGAETNRTKSQVRWLAAPAKNPKAEEKL